MILALAAASPSSTPPNDAGLFAAALAACADQCACNCGRLAVKSYLLQAKLWIARNNRHWTVDMAFFRRRVNIDDIDGTLQ